VNSLMERMLSDAEAEGFDAVEMPRMRELVSEYSDVWRPAWCRRAGYR
jgi:hypothetical protein